MPPKAKKGGKGAPLIIDGVDTSQMTREQLEVFCHRIKEENEREREERNFFQLERDKIRTFWEITRNELEEARAKLRNKDRHIEEEAEKNEAELKYFKQKVKHLQFEHQNELTEAKAEALVSLKMAQDDYNVQENQLLKDKRDLKGASRETELAHEDQIKALKLEQEEEISKKRIEFERRAHELELKFEKKFNEFKQEIQTKHNMEMFEVEERKNSQITELSKNHERAFNEMRNYYNDITLNNLALISSLKEQMEVLRKHNERMTKQVSDLTQENRKLVEPLKQAHAEVAEYNRQLQNYEKDKLSLANTKTMLKNTKRELDELRWANEALELRFELIEKERDELNENFMRGVLEVQQKTGLKNALLQKRVQTLTELAEQKDLRIAEMAATCDSSSEIASKCIQNMLEKKNATIRDLQYELARVCKAHDDLLDTYEDKLVKFGIPKAQLGFTPLRFIPDGQGGLPKGPAGLVTKNK